MERIVAVFVMIFVGLSAAAEPDWSCDFAVDDCGIEMLQGIWTRVSFNGNGMLAADVSTSVTGDMFVFSIPYNFTSPHGNVSFDYFIAGVDTVLLVSACRGDRDPVEQLLVYQSAPLDASTLIPYTCANIMDVQIIFNATRLDVPPLIRLDNIQIYETPYVEVPTTLGTMPPSTVEVAQTSMSTDGTITTRPTRDPPTPAVGDVSNGKDKPWLVPVIATIAVLLIITLLVVIVVFAYRRRKPNETKKPKPDIEYYADLRNHQETDKLGNGDDGTVNGNVNATTPSTSAADAFKVQGRSNVMSADLVGNPVYESGDATPRGEEGGASESLIKNQLYEGSGNDQEESNEEDGDGPGDIRFQQVRGNALYAVVKN
eukprot:XP_011672193.1 PREDICTED: uncharacterized protein LOC105442083 [Strongylocentrotus purpuratus]